MGEPPEASGAFQVMRAAAFPPCALRPVGESGAERGRMTGGDASDRGPVPTAFVATTLKVYDVAPLRPSTTQENLALEQLWPPGWALTSYVAIGLPPSEAGGSQVIVALPLAATPRTESGAVGASAMVTTLEATDKGLDPMVLLAVTRKV